MLFRSEKPTENATERLIQQMIKTQEQQTKMIALLTKGKGKHGVKHNDPKKKKGCRICEKRGKFGMNHLAVDCWYNPKNKNKGGGKGGGASGGQRQ